MSDEKSKTQAMREELSPDRIEKKLQEVVEERPKARHLLDFAIVGKAVLAAAVAALVLLLIFNAQIAGVALIVVFLGVWLGLAQTSYDRRRETRDSRSEEGSEEEPDESGYEGDRGEVEAQQEQEGEDDDGEDGESSRNGSAPKRETATSSN